MKQTEITVRRADESELPRVNEIRKMVNEVHVNGRPDIFRAGFCEALQTHIYERYRDENSDVLVAVINGRICGFATVEIVSRPESPYNRAHSYYHVEEFGVDAEYRRIGVATALVNAMKKDAAEHGLSRIVLDMWEFNESALAFYEAAGFKTFRRYMELNVE